MINLINLHYAHERLMISELCSIIQELFSLKWMPIILQIM